MKFKVGDKVRVRKDLKENNYYGGARFLFRMVRLIGKIVTIEQVTENSRRYYIKEDSENWCWTDEMLEKAEYTYEELKKSPIGTKVTFEDGDVLIKIEEDQYYNNDEDEYFRNNENLKGLKDNINLGKIIKIEEPEYCTVFESNPEILDAVEKRYLRNVIRPFRDKVKSIKKTDNYINETKNQYITITYKDNYSTDFPDFRPNTMYKGMKEYKEYTLEELGL